VILAWAPVPGASEYLVLRKIGAGEFAPAYRGPATYFSDPAAPPGQTATYRIVALVDGRPSEPSPDRSVAGAQKPAAPATVGAVAADGGISLKWIVPPDAAFSKVFRAERPEGPYTLIASGAFDTFVDRSAAEGRTYYYRFSIVDRFGAESDRSEPVAARPGAAAAAPAAGAAVRRVRFAGEFTGERFYPLDQPGDVLVGPSGEVFVVDRRSIQVFDRDGAFLRRIPFEPAWGLPGGMIFDGDGNLLVCFFLDQAIRRIDPLEGKPLQVIRDPFCTEENPVHPNDVAVDGSGTFWIVDGKRSRVLRADRTCSTLETLRRRAGKPVPAGLPAYDYPAPKKIYFNRYDGRIYLVLGARAEIVAIDPKTGAAVATFGGLGTAPERFSGVGGLAFRRDGHILVLDPFKQQIKEFDGAYRHVATYADVIEKNVVRLSADLSTAFAYREDMGRFYIASNLRNRVYIYDVLP